MFSLRGERTNCRIGEGFPPTSLVRTGSAGPNRKRCIEQKHTLVGPTPQTARCRYGNAKIIVQFLKDVLQRRRWGNAVAHGETEAFGLSGTVIGILAEEHDFDVGEGTTIERRKDFTGGGIAGAGGIFCAHEVRKCRKVGGFELGGEGFLPRRVDADHGRCGRGVNYSR